MVTDLRTEVLIFVAMKRIVLPLAIICGWCEGAAEKAEEARRHGYTVSHGMCPECAARFEKLAAENNG
jgi:hypothetical protein